jgi:hypothetical protein
VAEGSLAEGLGKVMLGGAVGFGLYLFITGLGFGGTGRGEGRGAGAGPAVPPSRAKDQEPLQFVLRSTGLHLRVDDPKTAKTYSLEEVIARIKEGGRADVELTISGGAREGTVEAVRTGLRQAGISVHEREAVPVTPTTPPSVSGNLRGQYGRRSAW